MNLHPSTDRRFLIRAMGDAPREFESDNSDRIVNSIKKFINRALVDNQY